MSAAFTSADLSISDPSSSWREKDGVIYFSVTSDGTSGEEWIDRMFRCGCRVNDFAERSLRSPDFKPTSGVTTEVAVLKDILFGGNNLFTKKIRAEADMRKLSKPNAELALLIREKFTDKDIKDMGLRCIVVMHEPINSNEWGLNVLSVYGHGESGFLLAYADDLYAEWSPGDGFAFALPQASL